MPMGPMELSDVVGLDVLLHVGEIVTRELHSKRRHTSNGCAQLVQPNATRAQERTGLLSVARRQDRAASPQRVAAPEDLADRLILALVNECVACLREAIVEDADLIDAGVIFGTGFAPFRGGPLSLRARARRRSLRRAARVLAERYGARFRPDAGWGALADTA
jgi:3-hydroxyacyl-CoA dehydrogenase/enoyl-CoA hydratase/3-hydroxybutyryl-CoA epimerase